MSGVSYGMVVNLDWHLTAEGETILQYFYNPQTNGRKLFGSLERPIIPSNIEEVCYKLFFVGKSGVGKSATIARLAGTTFPPTHVESYGIRKTNIFWPVKIWNKIILFELHCWESGDSSLKKYGHILPACKDKADAVVYVFSHTDASSFLDIPQLMNKLTKDDPDHPASIVIGTRYSATSKMEVSLADTKQFETKWQIPVLKMNKLSSTDRNETHKMAPLLNIICEQLWIRDQEYILKQGLSS